MKLLRCVAAMSFLVVVVVAPIHSSAAGRTRPHVVCDVSGRITPHGDWFSIHVPRFPAGPGEVAGIAVDHSNPLDLFVTNGVAVLGSADGGCHWWDAYQLPAATLPLGGFSVSDSRITHIEPAAGDVVYLGVQQAARVPRPHVLRSDDGGRTWTPATGGDFIGAVGALQDLAVATSHPETAYALVDLRSVDHEVAGVRSGQVVWATHDGGRTWEDRATFSNGVAASVGEIDVNLGASDVVGVEVDPLVAEDVWLYGDVGTLRSVDGGRTFSPVTFGPTGHLDLHHRPGLQTRVLAFSSDDPRVLVSVDGAQTFSMIRTPGIVDSAGHGSDPAEAMVGAEGRAYLLTRSPGPTGTPAFFDVSPPDRRPLMGVTGAGSRTIVAHTTRTIELNPLTSFSPPAPLVPPIAFPPGRGAPGPAEGRDDEAVDVDAAEPRVQEGRLRPRTSRIVLAPGESRNVDYTLRLPPSPTPLDVYFLVDVSSSMADTIAGVRDGMQEIVDRLAGSGLDVNFGAAIYRAFDDPPPYRRLRDILPVGPGLEDALNSLEADGGGRETQLYALLRSVDGGDTGGEESFNFRPGSMRVAIHATDEPFSVGGMHPEYAEVIEALVVAQVQQVGLAIQPPAGEREFPEESTPAYGLVEVARGTGAVAPSQGVDCDGDGAADVAEAQPLVCEIPPERSSEAALMAEAIVNVLQSLEDRTDLVATARAAGGGGGGESPVVDGVTPRRFPDVDLKRENVLRFEVRYACPRLAHRAAFPVDVAVSAPDRRLATARTVVECTVDLVPPPPPSPRSDPAAVIPPAAPIPAPPVARAPQPQPNPNPQAQPQPQGQLQTQGQAQPQAALAPQVQEQPQVAFVHAAHQVQSRLAGEHAMSALRPRLRPPLQRARLMVGASLLSVVFAMSVVRVRTRVARQRGGRGT